MKLLKLMYQVRKKENLKRFSGDLHFYRAQVVVLCYLSENVNAK